MLSRPGLRRLALRDVMTRGHLVPSDEAVRLVRSSVRCTVVEDVFETMRDGSARVIDMDRIEVPVLVAWGERDRILPLDRHAARFQGELPGVEFRVLRGLGHTPMWDDAGQIATLIGDFAAAAARRGNGQAPAAAAVSAAG